MSEKLSKRKIGGIIGIILVIVLVVVNVSWSLPMGSGPQKSMDSGYESEETFDSEASESSDYSSGNETQADDIRNQEQKIIITWNYNVETRTYEDSIETLNNLISELGGYVESENQSLETSSSRYASFTIRIPKDKENNWIEKINEIGTIVSKSKCSENVTLTYIDTESRLKALKTERESLSKLLESAKKVSDIIEIQGELKNVNYEIESYESQLRSLNNSIDYMTVCLYLSEVDQVSVSDPSVFSEISFRFINTINSIYSFTRYLFVSIIGYSIYVVIGLIVALIIWKKYNKNRNNKKQVEKDERKDSND